MKDVANVNTVKKSFKRYIKSWVINQDQNND